MILNARLVKGGASAFSLFLALTCAAAHAQSPTAPPASSAPPTSPQPRPVTGFVPPFEIVRSVRAAGFDPLAPPLREGTIYVLRATDFRGVLMRVVLDARTGAIRDVTRIVSASGSPVMMPPPYGTAPPYGASPPFGAPPYRAPPPYRGETPYGASADYEAPPIERGPAPPRAQPSPVSRPSSALGAPKFPPLPRPRPATLALQKSEKPVRVETGTGRAPEPAPDNNNNNNNAGAAVTPHAETTKPATVAPFND